VRPEDARDCAKAAADECANSRLDITKSKEITAKFGGTPVKSKDGKELSLFIALRYRTRFCWL
jgi:hypothetical protein